MYKTFTKSLFLLGVFAAFAFKPAFAQTITIGGNFVTGAYTPGSSIGVPFEASGTCTNQDNKFNLFLANASGTILSGTPIGTFSGFYGTYVNGTIPASTAPGTYTVVIKSTDPVATSAPSPTFTVVSGAAIAASVTGPSINSSNPNIFGSCTGTAGTQYFFSNNSGTPAATANFFNESSQTNDATVALAPTGSFTAQATNYTIMVQTTNGTSIATQAYFLVNNVVNNSFGSTNSNTVCLSGSGGTLTYNLDISSANGLQKNFPGNTYQVNWGDGSSTTYDLCELMNSGGLISHTYTSGSCGNTANGQTNAFEVDVQPESPYCGAVGTRITSYAQVIRSPTNSFTSPATACTGSLVTFVNTSDPGQDPNATANSCLNPNALYTWSVDGTVILANVHQNQNFTHTFTTNGNHTVTLALQSGSAGPCTATPVTQTICIQNPPQPAFTLPATACLSTPVTPTDQSVIDAGCNANPYLWTVTGPGSVTFVGGTTNASHQPQIQFSTPGTYTVKLTVSSGSCAAVSVSHTINIDGPPAITISANTAVCGTNLTFSFSPTGGITQTTISGTAVPTASTYSWTVTGDPGYTFVNGTSANSQYPQITFTDFATYTISVTVTNSCGNLTKSQNITFQNAPTVTITPSANPICPGSPVTLTANISGAYNTLQWTSTGSGIFSAPTSTTTNYTPSQAEINAGSANITVNVATSLTGQCANVSQNITITIYPVDNITSALTKQICTGSSVNYNITSSVAGSTYTWTAALTSGTATGFNSGSGATISDVLINNGTSNAVVTYTITPTDPHGCTGPPVSLKVTVVPLTTVTATPATNPICSGSAAGIGLTPSIPNATYTWTSTPTAGITGNSQQSTPTLTNVINDVLNNTGTTAGSVTYIITPYNATCPGPPTTVTINVQPLPAQANAGPNDEQCSITSYTLNGNTPPAGNGLWTVVSGPAGATFANASQPNTTVNGLVPGNTYQFKWTITIPGCQSTSSTVIIKDDATSVGGTTAGAATVCSGSNSGTITLSGQTGTVSRWESSTDGGTTWTTIANTTASQQYLNLTVTTEYRAFVQSGVCAGAYSSVTIITVNPQAVQANAGPNNEVCNTSTYTLQGNAPGAGSTGLWTVTSGPAGATFTDATQPNTTVNGLVPGTYKFTWTITPQAPCAPSANTVTIIIDPASVGGTTSGAATVCSGSNSGTITLSGQVGTVLRWESSTDNGTTWTTIANTTAIQQYANLNTTTDYRAFVQSGTCPGAYSSVIIITVNAPAVQANAGPNNEVCNTPTYALQGNTPGAGSTGLWTVTSGPAGATFTDATQPNTTVNGLVPGTYKFTWTITPQAPCAPSSSTVTIVIDPTTVGGTTAGAATVCSGNNSGTISLTGQVGTVITWQSSTDGGNTFTAVANTGTTLQYSNLTTTTQYRVQVQSGVCSAALSSVTIITVNPPAIQANAGPNNEVCNTPTYTLQGNTPGAGSTGLWTITSGPAGATFTDATQPNTTVNGLVPGTYQFTWTITPQAPCSPSSSTVTIIQDPATVGGTTSGAATVCSGSNSGTITLSGQVGTIITWQSSTDGGNTFTAVANTGTTLQYSNLTTTTQYRVQVQSGVCSAAFSSATIITVNAPAVQANAGPNNEVCNTPTYTLQGNTPGAGSTGLWTITSGPAGATFTDATQPNTTVNGLVPGTYQFTWTITPQAPCSPSSSTVTIVIDPTTVGGTTSGGATVCSGSNSGTITLTGQVGTIITWQLSTDGGNTFTPVTNNSGATLQYSNLTTTTQYRVQVQSGTCSAQFSSVTTIIVNQPTVQANAGGDQNLCGATTATLQGNAPAPFTGTWTQTAGPAATIVSPNSNQTQVTGLIPGNDYTFVWTIQGNPPCANSTDATQIHDALDVTPSFTAAPTTGCGTYTVNFTNTSTSLTGTTFSWDFGDGSAPSSAVNPSHAFSPRNDGKDTTYTVSLSIVNNCVQRPPFTMTVTVRPQNPVATIFPEQLSGCAPFIIKVDNTSPGTNTSYVFYLYNGSTLVQQITKTDKSTAVFDPVTASSGSTTIYTVYMVATGFCNNTTESNHIPITVSPASVTAQMFIEGGVNKGCAPLSVVFINNSNGGDNYFYTIYDVNNNVVAHLVAGTANFPYTFTTPGTFFVTITGSDNCSTSESPKTRVDVFPPPRPQFGADVTTACKQITVNFTNLTPDDPSAPAASLTYLWDFGDNTQSTAFTPPPHTYGEKGSPYTVTLTATNPGTGCSNVITKNGFIVVTSPPAPDFTERPDSVIRIPNYTFNFSDQSTGSPTIWIWSFGDGTSSTSRNPSHTYADTGVYKVTLTVASQLGCDSTISHNVRITGTPGQLFLPNAFEPDGTNLDLRTFIAKGSGIKEWHMQIFNNYSQLVWETTKLSEKGEPVDGWDGTFKGAPAPQGVYIWQVSATFINGDQWKGNAYGNSLPKRVGVIHLIR